MVVFYKELRNIKPDSFWHRTPESAVPVNHTESRPGRRDPQNNCSSGIEEHAPLLSHLLFVFWFLWWFEERGLLPLMCFLREKGQLPTWREALVYKRVCVGTKEMKPAVSSMWTSTAPEHEVTVSENLKAWVRHETWIRECLNFTVCEKRLETSTMLSAFTGDQSCRESETQCEQKEKKWPRSENLGTDFPWVCLNMKGNTPVCWEPC